MVWLMATALGVLLAVPPATPAAPGTQYEVTYHHVLRNKTDAILKDVVVYLPVPESDAYQQVTEFRVERDRPVHISNRTDEFGNKIKRVAIAEIAPKTDVEVGFSCLVSLQPPAVVEVNPVAPAPSAPRGLDAIPKEIRDRYTRDHNIFGLSTPVIKDAATALQKKHSDPVARARAIHDYVASTLKYQAGGGWDSAPQVLARKSGSCSEFTYVFCALCRATGIPTRFVGASIFPAKSVAPFQDHGHHRWAQAYLPGLGWVDFDPTLDAGNPAKQAFVGTHHGRTLVVTRTGDKSLQLGLSYLGGNNNTDKTSRSMWFTWSQGTMEQLAAARALIDGGDPIKGRALLREIVEKQPGTRAARDAAELLKPKAEAPTASSRAE
jgi:transglutaminase-like putative cysteine protease